MSKLGLTFIPSNFFSSIHVCLGYLITRKCLQQSLIKQSSLNEQEQLIMEMEARQQNLQKQTSMSDPERMMLDMESKEDDAEEEITEDYRLATNGNGMTASPANAENDANNGDDKGSADSYKSMHDFLHKYSDQQAEPPKPDSELCCFHLPNITIPM